MPPLTVALFGRSLILASVGTRLAANPRMRVVTLETYSIEAALGSIDPDVLMVDLDAIDVDRALALLAGRPDVLLVGLEADGARLLVLSGARARSLGTEDLVGLIERPGNLVATETSGDGFAAPLDARREAVGEREGRV